MADSFNDANAGGGQSSVVSFSVDQSVFPRNKLQRGLEGTSILSCAVPRGWKGSYNLFCELEVVVGLSSVASLIDKTSFCLNFL